MLFMIKGILRKEAHQMSVKFVTDDAGKRSAVIVPLKEWNSIMAKINTWRQDLETLSPEDKLDRREAYAELTRGESLDLRETVKKW